MLLLSIAAVVIFIIDLFRATLPLLDLLGITITEACLIVLLVQFEEVDEVQKLKRKLAKLEAEQLAADTRKVEMTQFWEQMQRLTDLWLHRTVPRLELTKEIQGYLTECREQELPDHLMKVNIALENLNKTLGAL